MKIIDKRRDYYDWVAGTYYDPNLVYERTPEVKGIWEVQKGNPHFLPAVKEVVNTYTAFGSPTSYRRYVVWSVLCVAGKMFPIAQICIYNWDTFRYDTTNFFLSNPEQEKAFLKMHKEHIGDKVRGNYDWWGVPVQQYYKIFCSAVEKLNAELAPWSLVSDAPVWVMKANDYDFRHTGDLHVVDNPLLLDYNLHLHVDPIDVYQTIAMYLGAKGVNENIQEIPDECKVTQKGFDPKYGFRKTPTKKRKK